MLLKDLRCEFVSYVLIVGKINFYFWFHCLTDVLVYQWFQLANRNSTASPCQIHMNQETNISSNARSPMVQHNKSAAETRKGLEQSGSTATSSRLHSDKHVISECQNGANISPEKADCSESGFSSSNEKFHVSYPAEHYSAKESIMYRKPPYTLGHTASSSQKLAENMSRGYHSQSLGKICDKENGSGRLRELVVKLY